MNVPQAGAREAARRRDIDKPDPAPNNPLPDELWDAVLADAADIGLATIRRFEAGRRTPISDKLAAYAERLRLLASNSIPAENGKGVGVPLREESLKWPAINQKSCMLALASALTAIKLIVARSPLFTRTMFRSNGRMAIGAFLAITI